METQKCLYEILGVERAASIDDIRSAYRKLALKWHPDKIQQSGASPEACQEATLQFQEIGRAYEVLADPGERAWYDSHRSQILSSSSSSASPEGFDLNLWPYFSPTVYSGYGETGKGFYSVYREVFTKLFEQELAFSRAYAVRLPVDPPDIGGPSSPYPHVSKFYSYWLGFGTVKDFSWCDEYKTTLGPNRKVRRLMEEENKKIRSKARKEFNEAVRRLAAFVKKRDKRVLDRQLELQRLEKEKEQKLKLKRQQAEAEKARKAKLYEEAEWTKTLAEDQAGDGDSDIEDDIGSYNWDSKAAKSNNRKDKQEEFFCIVCNKKFRSSEQWRNHEKSKKHNERVIYLKESFRKDDESLKAGSSASTTPETDDEVLSESNSNVEKEDVEDDSQRVPYADVKTLSSSPAEKLEEENMCRNGEGIESSWPSATTERVSCANGNDVFGIGKLEANAEIASNGTHFDDENYGDDSSNSAAADDDDDDDELSSLLSMVNTYADRQKQYVSEASYDLDRSGNLNVQNVTSKEQEGDGETEKEGEDEERRKEDEGEVANLTAMLNMTKNMQTLEDYEVHESSLVADFSGLQEDLVNQDVPKSRKLKVRRSEKNHAASFGRHDKLAKDLLLEKQMDRMILKSEASEVNGHAGSSSINTPDKNFNQATSNEDTQIQKGSKLNISTNVKKEQGKKAGKGKRSKANANILTNTCEICGEDFESRNQLFKHISVTNHAVLRGK